MMAGHGFDCDKMAARRGHCNRITNCSLHKMVRSRIIVTAVGDG